MLIKATVSVYYLSTHLSTIMVKHGIKPVHLQTGLGLCCEILFQTNRRVVVIEAAAVVVAVIINILLNVDSSYTIRLRKYVTPYYTDTLHSYF